MKLTNFRVHRFHPDRLDPVTVYVEEYAPGSSRITVQCYGRAWTAYWGNHGNCSVEHFMLLCNPEYTANSLTHGLNGSILKRCEKHDFAYLVRIVEAIQSHFQMLNERDAAAE
jgi:hypothetical protein